MANARLESSVTTRPIFQRQIVRARYRHAFLRQILGFMAVIGAWFAFDQAGSAGIADPFILDVGRFAAILLGGLFVVRTGVFLGYWVFRRDETVRFYKGGFVWIRGANAYKIPYQEVNRYREGARAIAIGDRPLLQWGAQRIITRDDQVFRLRPRHGNLIRFARVVRSRFAAVTAAHMGERLRMGEPIPLHRRLVVHVGGVEVGRHQVHWRDLAVEMTERRLTLRRRNPKRGKFRVLKRYRLGAVENVGGFYDLAQGTIRNHRQRAKQI